MKQKRSPVAWWRNLWQKHRLSLRNRHDNHEMWYMYISPLSLAAGFAALVLVLFIIILSTVAYTPLLEFLPGYQGNKSRSMLIENIVRLDSMERRLQRMRVYSDNIALIMEGKTPVVRNIDESRGEAPEGADKTLVMPIGADSLLRAQMEGEGVYGLLNSASSRRSVRETFELISPLAGGVVVTKFSPKQGIFGVRMAAPADAQVVAIEPGTVVMSLWTPEAGYVVQLQHAGNLLSVYKNLSQSMVSAGQMVKGGEIVGYSGGDESTDIRPFEFELWNDGRPVDPEGYIVF